MIKIVLEDIHGEDTIASICREYSIQANNYFRWKKELIEAGICRLIGDTHREATREEEA